MKGSVYSKWISATLLAAALCAGGCQGGAKKPTGTEQATQAWASARAGVLYSMANQQYESGQFDKARKTLDDALKIDSKNARILVLSAKVYIEQGNMEFAERDLQKSRELDPAGAEAEYLSGVIHQRWQRLEQAHDFYARAAEKAPTELAYLMARAEMLVALGRQDDALQALQARLITFEHSAAIRDAVGQILVGKGDYAAAVDFLRQASILAPEDDMIREHLAMARLYARQYREAADDLTRLVRKPAFERRADLLLALGECHFALGNLRDARANFDAASQADPGSAAAWLALAKAALQLDDLRRAEISARKALSLEPQNPNTHLTVGYLRLKQGRLSEALIAFRKASALDRKDTVALCMIGYVLERGGKPEEAMDYYAQALRIRPNDDLAMDLMARVDLND